MTHHALSRLSTVTALLSDDGQHRQWQIELDEPLDLQDGTEVVVTVTLPAAEPAESWVGNVPDDFEAQVYADRRREATRPLVRG